MKMLPNRTNKVVRMPIPIRNMRTERKKRPHTVTHDPDRYHFILSATEARIGPPTGRTNERPWKTEPTISGGKILNFLFAISICPSSSSSSSDMRGNFYATEILFGRVKPQKISRGEDPPEIHDVFIRIELFIIRDLNLSMDGRERFMKYCIRDCTRNAAPNRTDLFIEWKKNNWFVKFEMVS